MIDAAIKKISTGSGPVTLSGPRDAGAAMVAAMTARESGRAMLAVTPSVEQAARMAADLTLFTDIPVIHIPAYDIQPYLPLSPDPAVSAARVAAIYGINSISPPFIAVAGIRALTRRIPPPALLSGRAELVAVGEEVDREGLIAWLSGNGFERVSLVQNHGEFSVRGEIIDLFAPQPPDSGLPPDLPVRLDFFGDTLESIRLFDPVTQRSVQEAEELVILPASKILFHGDPQEIAARLEKTAAGDCGEITAALESRSRFPGIEFFLPLFWPETTTIPAAMPEDAVIFCLDPDGIGESLELARERAERNFAEVTEQGCGLPVDEIFEFRGIASQVSASARVVGVREFHSGEDDSEVITLRLPDHTLLRQEIETAKHRSGIIPPLARRIEEWSANGERTVIACRSERHARQMKEILENHGIKATDAARPLDIAAPAGTVAVIPAPLSNGFDVPDMALHLVSEIEIFGARSMARKRRRDPRLGERIRFEELKPGEIVVHRDHGLGVYAGIENIEVNSIRRDFIRIDYQGGDRLFVPVEKLNLVHKYQGISDRVPQIDRLGGKKWQNAKQRVRREVWKVAADLLTLYAKREMGGGRRFSPGGELFAELEESFIYDETPGQAKAIREVLEDLASPKITDRLVCGDVGYGKTEVAVRAAFKVIEDGAQVAFLVPTTVLAEQHAATFAARFANLPVTVRTLTRFRTQAEQRKTLKELAEGRVDLVIGTHRILSDDVRFADLGLVIIDEEHRFGVKHKEKLKKLRQDVDVITLSATPIPRTLQMALLGIRDLSVINTPPGERLPVKTYISRDDDLVIREAISRELQRGGQVFVVHNRVRTIHRLADRIKKLKPEANVAVAHGQMKPAELEKIMLAFVARKIDVLVCTTIIESGLDIPSANTIIITRADLLGLAEIYQLRGRVGRSSEQAYAYLLLPDPEKLPGDAKRRIRALMDYSDLGGGFKLAMSDLQIRGGGSLLGESQSGQIAAVGYDLYLELLQRTVEELKQSARGGRSEPELDPEINLRVPAFIPEDYIPDTGQRYLAYRRISAAANDAELEEITDELIDRYGPVPAETANIIGIVSLKPELVELRATRLEQGKDRLVIYLDDSTPLDPVRLVGINSQGGLEIKLLPGNRVVVGGLDLRGGTVIEEAKKTLQTLVRLAT